MLNSSAFTAWSRTVAVAQSSAWWKFLRLGSFVLDACLGVSAWDTNSTRLLMREDWSLAESWVKSKSDPSQDDTSLWHFERKRVREADRKRTEPMASAIRMPVGYPQLRCHIVLEIWCSMSLTSHYSSSLLRPWLQQRLFWKTIYSQMVIVAGFFMRREHLVERRSFPETCKARWK